MKRLREVVLTVLLILPLAVAAAGTPISASGSEAFWDWLRGRSDTVHVEGGALDITEPEQSGGAGRGVIAGKELPQGLMLASFPLSSRFVGDGGGGDEDLDEGHGRESKSETCSLDRTTLDLAAALLRETSLGKESPYHAWIQLLPAKDSFSLFRWNAMDKWYLARHDLPILKEYEARVKMIASAFARIGLPNGISVPRGTSLSDLRWAVSIVLSRAFDLVGDSRQIIPGLDFFNHCASSRNNALQVQLSPTSIDLYTTRLFAQGEPLCINYAGAHGEILSSKRSFLQYGFVIPHTDKGSQTPAMDHDIVDIPFTRFASPDVIRILSERGIYESIHIRSTGVDDASLMALRVAALENLEYDINQREEDLSDEMDMIFAHNLAISTEHDKQALDILRNVTRDAISARNRTLSVIAKERRMRRKRRKKKMKRKKRSRHEVIIRNMLRAENDTLSRYAAFMSNVHQQALAAALEGVIHTKENFHPFGS